MEKSYEAENDYIRLLEPSLTGNEIEAPSLEVRFNRTLVESVEETIAEVLGRRVAEAFSYHFHASIGLSKEDVPSHLQELSSELMGSFGVGGAVLGRAIVRKLSAKLGLSSVQKPDGSFVERIEELKKMFLMGAGGAR
jgi:hypothetical protein